MYVCEHVRQCQPETTKLPNFKLPQGGLTGRRAIALYVSVILFFFWLLLLLLLLFFSVSLLQFAISEFLGLTP